MYRISNVQPCSSKTYTFSYDIAYLRLYACYGLDFGVDFYILNVENLRKSMFGYLPTWP